jgi:hypothetical protein
MPEGTINHGRHIVRELWWKKHRRMARILSFGLGAIVAALCWAWALHVALARMVENPLYLAHLAHV